jgi:hypothetical protein
MSHIHWVAQQNKLEIPNDEEEVNTREIHKCDGQAHDPDTMVAPLTPKLRKRKKKFRTECLLRLSLRTSFDGAEIWRHLP